MQRVRRCNAHLFTHDVKKYSLMWKNDMRKKKILIILQIYFRCSNFSPSASIHIWIFFWMPRFTSCRRERNMLAQASVMRRLTPCDVCRSYRYICYFNYPYRKMSFGIRWGEYGGQSLIPPCPIVCFLNSLMGY